MIEASKGKSPKSPSDSSFKLFSNRVADDNQIPDALRKAAANDVNAENPELLAAIKAAIEGDQG